MAERRTRSTPPLADDNLSFIDFLDENVTQSLTQRRAIRDYWEQIKDVQSKLWSGLIRNEHELELVLISRNTVITSELEGDSALTES